MCMVIYMSSTTTTATNNTTGETYEVRSLGLNMERNIARKFGVTFASHTVDQANRSVTWTATNGQTITARFAA